MALLEVRVPDIGDFDEVEVIELLVAVGDQVVVEQSLVTLESDKATMELPSPQAGVIRELHVALGDKVSQGSPLVTIEAAAEEAAGDAEPAGEPAAPSEAPVEPAPPTTPPSEEPEPRGDPPVPNLLRQPLEGHASGDSEPIDTLQAPAAAIPHASPSVRRLAREFGIDLLHVSGTGRKGRILKLDLQAFVKSSLAAIPESPHPAAELSWPKMPEIDFSKYGEVERESLNKIRRASARNLHRSWVTVPHVTQFDEADITDLEEFRRSKAMSPHDPQQPKLTILVFLMKALTVALKDFPQFNSSLDPNGEELILKKYFHIGVAVDTENGLMVPVIRDVDKKGLVQLSQELAEISQRARDRKLGPEDLSGASITISCLGGIGGTAFTPIVNAPEVAILGVSRAQIKPVYQDGEFQPRLFLPLSLSYDHRVIDGADAVRFTTRLASVVSDVRNLIL